MVLPKGFKLFIVTPGRPASLKYTLISPGNALVLSPQGGAIMLALLANYGRPVAQETILATMYPADRPPNAIGVLRATLARLREHLEGYLITFDIYNDHIPRPDLGPSLTLLNLRQHAQDQPQDRPSKRPKGQPQEAAPLRSSPERRGMVRPLNDDVAWTFPNRIEARNRRKAS